MREEKGGGARRADLRRANEINVATGGGQEHPAHEGGIRKYAHAAGLCLVAAVLAWEPATAQDVPTGPIAPTREEVERVPLSPTVEAQPRLTVEGGIERAPCALADPAYRDVTFTVSNVIFEDLKAVSPEILRPAYADYLGSEQPIAVVCEIRDRAATILRDAGYIAAVQVPEQRIADGTVRFKVLMAKLVGVRVRGDAGRAERTIAAYLERLTEQEVFNRFDAERYLLLAGDLPGYDVRLSLRSAEAAPGEVIGEVAVLRTPGQVDFNVQNFGSRDLGRWGGLLRGQFYGLTGLGDRTTVAFFSTADFDEQQTLQLGHDFRLGGEGLTLSGQFTYAWADPDLGDPRLDVKARTLLATVEAAYPLIRTQAQTLRGAAGLDIINQKVRFNDLPLTRDQLRVAFARLDLEATDPDSINRLGGYSIAEPRWRFLGGLELRQGLDLLGASDDCGPSFARCRAAGAVPISRLEGDPTGTVFRFNAYGEYRPVPNIAFALGMKGQATRDPLLSFEEFSVGNYTVGRGYDPGTLLGDNGLGFQAEVRFGSIIPQTRDSLSVQPYLFVDTAWVWNEDRLNARDVRQDLTSIGGGLRALYGDRLQLDVALAVPLERAGVLATEKPDPRLLVSLTTRLWPWSF
ncbi:ShlB/FhaC/HecB family hemolysin secretion/activation protein [Sphingosinicella humi]|uniref:ShlB/FhaC/HecB family hemolysin secretion/activation protein n=1 Tax=Allosphingosinicella humi TaxID=2068657 RepID=A0A2U2J697_9SPHN|nr:ShlB/FhaC/HecB family hemolysin secretion/activation protein [Sphingosinicella humi]